MKQDGLIGGKHAADTFPDLPAPTTRAGLPGHAFVFAVVGDQHVQAVATALTYLKKFSRADIIVLQSRSSLRAPHDQVVEVELPAYFDNHQASILLKTGILDHVRGLARHFCYIDSDVIAVHAGVDDIFRHRVGPVTFALDHSNIDSFSRWAINCNCRQSPCHHLREAIFCDFGIDVRDCGWTPWNGGVFLFDADSEEFLSTWHQMTRSIMTKPYWRTRDQGTLVAAAWKFGLERQAPLPSNFNFIVDRLWGIPLARRASAAATEFCIRDDYSLSGEAGRIQPRFIHFVNGGVGQRGWRHWDEVAALGETPL